jgi:hypothetical protein
MVSNSFKENIFSAVQKIQKWWLIYISGGYGRPHPLTAPCAASSSIKFHGPEFIAALHVALVCILKYICFNLHKS